MNVFINKDLCFLPDNRIEKLTAFQRVRYFSVHHLFETILSHEAAVALEFQNLVLLWEILY